MKRPRRQLAWSHRRSHAAFTLTELMMSIAVLGILLGVGIPSFREMTAANRLTAVVNDLVTALNVARAEAGKRGIPVTVCSSNTAQTGCAGSSSWNTGWIVFTDDTGTAGTLDGSDELLEAFPAPVEGYSVTPTSPTTLTYIRFRRSGAPDTGTATRTIKLSRPSCTGTKARQVSIASAGRVSSGKISC